MSSPVCTHQLLVAFNAAYLLEEPECLEGPQAGEGVEEERVGMGSVVTSKEAHVETIYY